MSFTAKKLKETMLRELDTIKSFILNATQNFLGHQVRRERGT